MTISATYDPADDKIRMRSETRLDPEIYTRVKAAGFGWAPKQGCFYAVWNPEREDLARELSGSELGDEDTTLAERAEARAERFGEYHGKRAEESERAAEAVGAIADNIPLGQPIICGHHSEKRARKDAERIENGMRKAVNLWKTAEYWERRARGVLSHVEYKERPEVRARRIKGLEADARKRTREKDEAARFLRGWQRLVADPEAFKHKDGTPSTLLERAKYLANYDRGVTFGTWGKLDRGEMTAEAAQAEAVTTHQAQIADYDRWLEHLTNRLSYERALLGTSGFTPPVKASKAALPLLNLSGEIEYRCPYSRENTTTTAIGITKAAFAILDSESKGTRISADGTYRVRCAYLPDPAKPGYHNRTFQVIYLTNAKEHKRPSQETVDARGAKRPPMQVHDQIEGLPKDLPPGEYTATITSAEIIDNTLKVRSRFLGTTPTPPRIAALAEGLKAGVQVTVAPQLFPTPPELARRMAELADCAGKRVLEPSAGTGNLVRAIFNNATGADNVRVVAVEVNQALVEGLKLQRQRTVGANGETFAIEQRDFLQCQPGADLGYFRAVIMNPPFDHGLDIAHIKHAMQFLKPGGILVAICANGPRQQAELKPLASTWEELPADTFTASGTHVRTVLLTIKG